MSKRRPIDNRDYGPKRIVIRDLAIDEGFNAIGKEVTIECEYCHFVFTLRYAKKVKPRDSMTAEPYWVCKDCFEEHEKDLELR